MAPLFVQIMEAFRDLDLKRARQLQLEAIRIIRVLIKYGGSVKAGKYFMRMVGLDLGGPRLAVNRLSGVEQDRMKAELEALGFFQYGVVSPK